MSSVILRAQLLGGTPSELLGAITGLTEARFPIHAAAHFSDGFPAVKDAGRAARRRSSARSIYAPAGSPVIATQDGEIVQLGDSPTLGHFIALKDAYGNTYVYAELGDVSSVYPVLQPHVDSTVSSKIERAGAPSEPDPDGPASAGVQPRSPISEGAPSPASRLARRPALNPRPPQRPSTPAAPDARPGEAPATVAPEVKAFKEGSNEVYLHPLHRGAQVIAGTVLGHVGRRPASTGEAEPHIVFQIRPAGLGAPLIDPKPILDGWVALENSSVFHAKGENPFLATSPTVGQVLLETKQQLQPQVLHDKGIRLGSCGRQDVQEGRVDKRVLAMLEYLSVSGLRPTVGGLRLRAGDARRAGRQRRRRRRAPVGHDHRDQRRCRWRGTRAPAAPPTRRFASC